jgi:hypothetical protein
VVPDAVGSVDACSIGDVNCCVGSLLLDSSDAGRGANGSSSNDSMVGSFSEGRLSLSNSCMSAHVTPRYGLFDVVSCSSSCQSPPYRVTALVFFPKAADGLKRRTSYPHLFLLSRADTNVICSLFACADLVLLRVMWVSSNQMRVLLVSLELAMVEQSRV